MNEIYGIQLLLQSKNPLLFNKTEKLRMGNLLQESSHFKLAITSLESKRNILRLYKYVIMKKYNKNQFVYHKIDPDNHLYIILKGKVACFVPNSQANLLGVIQWSNEGQKPNNDNNSFKYINRDDEELLNSDLYYSHVYFNGNNCLYRKIKTLLPGESFGGYTQYHEASFIATEDTTLIVLPFKKYEYFFQQESYRYNFINRSLAEMFCNNEQNVRMLIQEEEKLSQIIQQGNNPNNSPISPTKKAGTSILDTVFSQYASHHSQQKSKKSKGSMNKIEILQFKENNNIEEQNQQESQEERKLNDSEQNSTQIFEEKRQSVELMLRFSELSFHFELHKFEMNGYVYNENDAVDYYYLISSGKMLLKKSGLQEPIKEYTEGDFLGFEDDQSKRIFSCYAEADTVVYRILKRDFEMNINNNIFSFFKQLQRYKKKQSIEIYKEMKESGMIRGLHRKVKSLNTRDIHYKLQLKKQIAQEILEVMQNSKFNSAKQHNSPPSGNSNNNFYQLNSNNNGGSQTSTITAQNNSSRLRSTMSMHNLQEKNNNKNHVRFNIEQESTQMKHPSPALTATSTPNQLQKFTQLSNPLKIQFAQRMVMDQIKKTAQIMEDEKKKVSTHNNFNRNIEIQFKKQEIVDQSQQQPQQTNDLSPILKRNIFSSQSLHRSSSTLNRFGSIDSSGLSPLTKSPISKSRPIKQELTPLNLRNMSPSYSMRNSDVSLSQQLFIPLRGSYNSSISEQEQSILKNNFMNYKKMQTFSNIYHNKKNILAISPLNIYSDVKKDKKVDYDEPEVVKSNQNSAKVAQDGQLETEVDEMQQINLENPEWLLETAKRIKDIDVNKIKSDIERQILSIPKQYQDKLWGQNAYRSVSLKFQSQK